MVLNGLQTLRKAFTLLLRPGGGDLYGNRPRPILWLGLRRRLRKWAAGSGSPSSPFLYLQRPKQRGGDGSDLEAPPPLPCEAGLRLAAGVGLRVYIWTLTSGRGWAGRGRRRRSQGSSAYFSLMNLRTCMGPLTDPELGSGGRAIG